MLFGIVWRKAKIFGKPFKKSLSFTGFFGCLAGPASVGTRLAFEKRTSCSLRGFRPLRAALEGCPGDILSAGFYADGRAHEKMTDYFKGFVASFLIHGAVLTAVLCCTPEQSAVETDLLMVDFSAVTMGAPREGGSLPGSGTQTGSVSGKQARRFAAKPASSPDLGPKDDKQLPLEETPAKVEIVAQADPQTARIGAEDTPQRQHSGGGLPGGSETGKGEGLPGGSEAGKGDSVSGGKEAGEGSGPGSGSGTKQGPAQGYIKANFSYILACIRRNVQYPDLARRQKLAGTADFTFIIRQDGTIEDLRLQKSSGHSILDEAGWKAIQQAVPFPRPPVPARIVIPIDFRMG